MSANIRLTNCDNLAVLTWKQAASEVNLLSRSLLSELRDQLTALAGNRELAGLVIISGQETNFCTGLDPALLEGIKSAAEARALAQQGQELCQLLAGLALPTVAAIHGPCLGGGLELALACDYRILSADPSTTLGLPETHLGIIPAFGSSQRLPRLVGIRTALAIFSGGAPITAAQALALGLADTLVPREHLLVAARRQIQQHPATGRPRRNKFLDRLPLWRQLLCHLANRAARRQHGDHYPAIAAAISAVAAGCNPDPAVGLESAAHLLGEMAMTDTARHLQQVYRLQERFTREAGDETHHFSRVAVVGAGAMGTNLITLLAEQEVRGRLLNRSLAGLKAALGGMGQGLASAVQSGGLTPAAAERIRARISYDTGLRGLRGQEVIIETVAENLGVKKSVLADIAREVPAETLIITSTNSLAVSELAQAVVHPDRVVGLHLFNPSAHPQLVEVIVGHETSETTRRAVMALAGQLGKIPLPVQDSPGFLINRLLLPYLNEAARLLDSGVKVATIDRAMVNFGMPLGPFALLDAMGLDIAAPVAETLHRAFGDRLEPSPLLSLMAGAGRLGNKSGQGFYLYEGGQRRRVAPDLPALLKLTQPNRKQPPPAEIVDRLLLAMLNEAARCLEDGVVAEAAALDTALLFGIGFPAYTGGLLRYADDRSANNVLKKLRELEVTVGKRYAPAQLLRTLADCGRNFYES
ncbi:MAG: hypothetical protein HGA96_03710 [Desulfobulbaceae bacterium]|nr:hypothetical protein [Desulfobulbaceae bacterium]